MATLRNAEYDRLRRSIDLGGTLAHVRDSARMRPVLEQIIENGQTTLERAGDVGDPYLLSNTHMTLAAAEYDLASVDQTSRAQRVAKGTRHCFTALKLALDSGTTLLSTLVLPWSLVVLTGGLRAASGTERAPIEALMAGSARKLPEEHERQQADRRRGAVALFESQLLLNSARRLSDPRERGIVLRRAADSARDARRVLLGAGDRDAARQAATTLREIEAASSR